MKRLFQVGDWYFDNKEYAKAHRDMLNADSKTQRVHVQLGPDHWRYGEEKLHYTPPSSKRRQK